MFQLPTATCERCDHTWTPRKPSVSVCPSCKSPYWASKPKPYSKYSGFRERLVEDVLLFGPMSAQEIKSRIGKRVDGDTRFEAWIEKIKLDRLVMVTAGEDGVERLSLAQ